MKRDSFPCKVVKSLGDGFCVTVIYVVLERLIEQYQSTNVVDQANTSVEIQR